MKNPITIWRGMSVQVKASFVFLLATLFLKGVVFLTTPIFTRIMSQGDIGIVGTYQSWRGIFEVVCLFSLASAGVFEVGMSKYKDCRDKYMSNMVCMCAVLALIGGTIFFFSYDYLKDILQIPKSLVLLMALYALCIPAQTFWISKQRYEYKYKAAFLVTIIVTTVGQIMSIVAVCIFDYNLSEVRLWAAATVELPVGLFFLFVLLKRGGRFYDKGIWKETLLFAIPLMPHYLSSIVLTASDRIMISILDSGEAAGIYTVISGIATITTIVWGAIQGSLTPYIYDKLDRGDIKGIDSLAERLILGFGLMCIIVSLVAPEVVLVLGSKTYMSGAYAVPPINAAMFVACFYNLFSVIEFYHRKSIFITIASIVAAISNVVLNWLFIPIYGFVVAGYTTLASYIVLAIMHYWNMKRIDKRPIYNIKRLCFLGIGLLVVINIPIILYDTSIIRYIIALILIAIVIRKRKMLLSVGK